MGWKIIGTYAWVPRYKIIKVLNNSAVLEIEPISFCIEFVHFPGSVEQPKKSNLLSTERTRITRHSLFIRVGRLFRLQIICVRINWVNNSRSWDFEYNSRVFVRTVGRCFFSFRDSSRSYCVRIFPIIPNRNLWAQYLSLLLL